MPPRATRARGAAKAAPVVNGTATAPKKRKAADADAKAAPKKRAKTSFNVEDLDAAISDIEPAEKPSEKPSKKAKAPKAAPRRADAKTAFSVEPKSGLAAFRTSPPDTSSLPVINEAPTDVLTVYVFGTGDMSGELGLGSKKKEAKRATAIPKLNPKESDSYRVVQLDCGGMHNIALTEDSKIVTWGGNDLGALGRDSSWEGGLRDMDDEGAGSGSEDSDDELNPVESIPTHIPKTSFPPGTKFTCVAAGDSCSFAVTDTGLVYGWGTFTVSPSVRASWFPLPLANTDPSCQQDSEANQCFLYYKDETIKKQERPMLVPGLQNIKSVVCGANHAVAIDHSGRIWTWGVNEKTQVGRRVHAAHNFKDNFYPGVADMSRYGVKSVAAGPYHSLAVDNKDRVFAWGMNNFGQAGYASNAGADSAELPYPMQIKPLSKQGIEQMAAGSHHSVAVTKDGRALVWGRIDGGHLGLKLSQEQIDNPKTVRKDEYEKPRILLQPTAVPNIGEATFAACSTGHTIFINREGKAFASGFGAQYQLGNAKDDDVEVAEELKGKQLEGVRLSWCGTGGQFSMVAAPASQQINGQK